VEYPSFEQRRREWREDEASVRMKQLAHGNPKVCEFARLFCSYLEHMKDEMATQFITQEMDPSARAAYQILMAVQGDMKALLPKETELWKT
jgi:hypothetical protein